MSSPFEFPFHAKIVKSDDLVGHYTRGHVVGESPGWAFSEGFALPLRDEEVAVHELLVSVSVVGVLAPKDIKQSTLHDGAMVIEPQETCA